MEHPEADSSVKHTVNLPSHNFQHLFNHQGCTNPRKHQSHKLIHQITILKFYNFRRMKTLIPVRPSITRRISVIKQSHFIKTSTILKVCCIITPSRSHSDKVLLQEEFHIKTKDKAIWWSPVNCRDHLFLAANTIKLLLSLTRINFLVFIVQFNNQWIALNKRS